MHRLARVLQFGALLIAWSATTAVAQPASAPAPQSAPADLGFGTQEIANELKFEASDAPLVDRREEIDAAVDRVILFPNAYTPRKGKITLSTHMLLMSQLSYAFTDDFQLTTSVVAPFWINRNNTPILGLSGKFTVSEGSNHVVSVAPFAQGRAGHVSASDFGGGAALLVDLMTSNRLVTSLGLVAYGNLVRIEDRTELDCRNRSDYITGSCDEELIRTSTAFPSTGHFLAAHAGLTWYFHEHFSFRGEAITGLSAGGSTLGLAEAGPDGTTNRTTASTTEPEPSGVVVGFPGRSAFTLGTGFQWSNGLFSFQASTYFLTRNTSREPGPTVYMRPMLNLGVSFK